LLLAAGSWIHKLALTFSGRSQSKSTWFLRNEPLLLTIRDLVAGGFISDLALRLCVVGCSTGNEIYSILWMIRKAQPNLKILPIGIDISESAIARARAGRYSLHDSEITAGPLHSRSKPVLSEESIRELFDKNGEQLKIKNWIAEGIRWEVGDARDPGIVEKLGVQDIVIANNFLVHMKQREATACLGNILRLVKPDGFFVCRGVDLDIREIAAERFRLRPVQMRIEEIHNADPDLDARRSWPWKYYGLEPLDKRRKNWVRRYASVFQVS
jgi:SAM-dependent methyltransferase